jgi:hypothetical protein
VKNIEMSVTTYCIAKMKDGKKKKSIRDKRVKESKKEDGE